MDTIPYPFEGILTVQLTITNRRSQGGGEQPFSPDQGALVFSQNIPIRADAREGQRVVHLGWIPLKDVPPQYQLALPTPTDPRPLAPGPGQEERDVSPAYNPLALVLGLQQVVKWKYEESMGHWRCRVSDNREWPEVFYDWRMSPVHPWKTAIELMVGSGNPRPPDSFKNYNALESWLSSRREFRMAYGLRPLMIFRRGRFIAADYSSDRWFGTAGYTPPRFGKGMLVRAGAMLMQMGVDMARDTCPGANLRGAYQRGLMKKPAHLQISGLGSSDRLEISVRGGVVVGECDNLLGSLLTNRVLPPVPHHLFYRVDFNKGQWKESWGAVEENSWDFPLWREYTAPPEKGEQRMGDLGDGRLRARRYLNVPFSSTVLYSRGERREPDGL